MATTPVNPSPVPSAPATSPNTQTKKSPPVTTTNTNNTTNTTTNIPNTQGEQNGNYVKRNPSHKKNWDPRRSDSNGNIDVGGVNGTQRRERNDRGDRSDRSNRTDNSNSNNNISNTTTQNGESSRPEKRYYDPREARGRNDEYYRPRRANGERQDRNNNGERPDRQETDRRREERRRDRDNNTNYQPVQNNTNNGNTTTTTSTSNNVAPTQQQPTFHPPQVDHAKLEQSKRINSLISVPQADVTPEQRAKVNEIQEIVGPTVNEADIYKTLQEVKWNHEKAVISLLGDDSSRRWSDVVRKKKEPKPEPSPRDAPREQREPRPDRSDRQKPRRDRPNGHQGPHGDAPPGLSQPAYQQIPPEQPQLQGQQFPPQSPPATQVPEQPHGEELIMGLSKAIEEQLKEIAEKTRLLLQMQNELNSIHNTGKDRLTSLQDEKRTLVGERERLQEQLKSVEERLVFVDDAIAQAEKEKFLKLKDWQRKSATHGLITSGPVS